MSKRIRWSAAALLLCFLLTGCDIEVVTPPSQSQWEDAAYVTAATIPDYAGDPYVAVNNNVPTFTEDELTTSSYEFYSELDELGRCGVTEACVGLDLMPTEKRESISSVKPTGWVQAQYDCVDGKSLYNRCHLIGFQLSGENANKQNLITGTRYLNVDGMLPFENLVADYVKETENHVLYRVTPIYDGDNLVAGGVVMEGKSVEDDGEGVCFHVYVYNVQPGVEIDYATGLSWLEGTSPETSSEEQEITYVLNINSKKFHLPTCSGAANMKAENREESTLSREELIDQGYTPCGTCKP